MIYIPPVILVAGDKLLGRFQAMYYSFDRPVAGLILGGGVTLTCVIALGVMIILAERRRAKAVWETPPSSRPGLILTLVCAGPMVVSGAIQTVCILYWPSVFREWKPLVLVAMGSWSVAAPSCSSSCPGCLSRWSLPGGLTCHTRINSCFLSRRRLRPSH